ncbi:MAG: membrane protein insertion efficiency factor YidD [Chlamydiae bacterium GWC2_50_10]|nr:MAG: membrane protein insertion efficiency factor YidD [Chlamydiae bacterium GWA2_50_15]OGN54789.1 MAG: membrane protein insertion efficiency factor YidD [Chlamydiae bacterium GWC2_50_10]OGN55001.1 MAG: membrane protein insertion efficiency factor YidD [Chlamydiae bacterium GWF2_49_8]OGN58762.1 MAG: membrane protein insertion efficiency factor YidD [Chlamydiae bacterium RIFCSPHIGHO2_02_FULL_49_29]OGN64390.1 MAG: membrane protein insertion efficiency factor YidD [Chlamydiae bacterium RIFCSPHI
MRSFLLFLMKLYQWIVSPLLGNRCRFYPSCSEYGIEAVQKHGPAKGLWLTSKRLLKCGPWHRGGVDEVP